jgi:glutaredoxin-like protein
MPMLSDKDRKFLIEYLDQSLTEPVIIKLFTQSAECQFCKETKQLLEEVEDLSDKIELQVHDLVNDKEIAEEYGVRKIPATIVMGRVDYGIRFYGIPSGYEFNTLIEDIVAVSNEAHGLSDAVMEKLERVQEPVHMQVFVTPTCPYCPAAVRTAHAFAMASEQITADMVEAVEFPQVANRYNVMGVPKTVINESTELEGAAPEELVVAKVLEAVGLMSAEEVAALFAGFEGELETT